MYSLTHALNSNWRLSKLEQRVNLLTIAWPPKHMSLMYVGKKHGLKNILNLWLCVLLWGLCCNLKVVCGSHMNCHFVSPETNNAIQSAIPQKWVGHTHELSFCEFGKLIIRWLKVPFHSPKMSFEICYIATHELHKGMLHKLQYYIYLPSQPCL